MPSHKHVDSTLIDRVGKKLVSDAFNLSPQALCNWRKRGIPLVKRVAFAKLCSDHGVIVPNGFFDDLHRMAIGRVAA